jgi:hypothetical protein
MHRKDLTNQRFGRLIAVSYVKNDKHNHAIWLCLCDCGNTANILGTNLIRGLSISCGCFRKEFVSVTKTTHGMTETKLYKKWEGMKRRCLYETGSRNGYYKAIGVTICDDGMHSFETFRDWALHNGYSETLSLDRIDNYSGYFPMNCRWVTQTQQMNNTRRNRRITYNAVTHTLAEWSRIISIDAKILRHRLDHNWPVIDILFTPKGCKQNGDSING